MNINPVSLSFGILKSNKSYIYGYKSCINNMTGKYKDYNIKVRNDYVLGELHTSLIYISRYGEWIKSKLRYFENGKVSKVFYSSSGKE